MQLGGYWSAQVGGRKSKEAIIFHACRFVRGHFSLLRRVREVIGFESECQNQVTHATIVPLGDLTQLSRALCPIYWSLVWVLWLSRLNEHSPSMTVTTAVYLATSCSSSHLLVLGSCIMVFSPQWVFFIDDGSHCSLFRCFTHIIWSPLITSSPYWCCWPNTLHQTNMTLGCIIDWDKLLQCLIHHCQGFRGRSKVIVRDRVRWRH